jgi:hypothetical protein
MTTESKLRQRTVGRLDRTRDAAILNAAPAALTENGCDATNMTTSPRAPASARRRSIGDGHRKPH